MSSGPASMGAKFEGAETARRALRLLEVVVTAGEPVRLAELGDAVGLSKSTCYRLVRVLQDERYLERLDSGGYQAGSRLVGVAAAVLSRAALYPAALPTLRGLAAEAGETVTLHVRSADRAVLVLGAESTDQVLRRAARIGETTPLVRGCSGQSILAFLPDTDAAPIIAGAEDPVALRVRLAAVRAAGYVISLGANHPGVHGVAAPVPGSFPEAGATGAAGLPGVGPRAGAGVLSGAAALSVAVSGPAQRWTEQRMHGFVERLVAACAELSELFAVPSLARVR